MTKVNIREALNQMDKDTDCKYDLVTLYESCNLTEEDKKDIAKSIADKEDADVIYDKLVDKYGDDVSFDDDDINDLKFLDMSKEAYLYGEDNHDFEDLESGDNLDVEESFSDDLIDSQYLDDTSDGHWSWDYDDDELANIYGGDTRYDYHPDGIEESQNTDLHEGNSIADSKEIKTDPKKYVKAFLKDFNIPKENVRIKKGPYETYAYRIPDDCFGLYITLDDNTVALQNHGLDSVKEKYQIDSYETVTTRYFGDRIADQKLLVNIKEASGQQIDESKSIKESSSGPKYVTRDIINKTNSQKLRDAYDKGELEVLINGDVWYTERYPKGLGKELKAEMKRLYPDTKHLYGESVESELEIRKQNYLKAKEDFETLGEKDNNDVLSREEKMLIAKAEYEKVLGHPIDESLKEDSSNNGWVKRWNFLDKYYKGDLVISKISSPVDAWHIEKVDPNGHTIKHLGNYKSLESAIAAADKLLMKNESIEDTSIEDIDKFVAEVKEKFPGSEAIYDGDTNTIKITLDNVQKENLTEDSIESDELETADQKISSANTSINSSKLPAIFRLVKFEPDTLNLDYGGGKFDNAAEYLAQQNVTNLVYDPYNRSTQHNAEVLQNVRENGGADTITISNVLNVIAEPEARLTVLRNAKKLVKPGGNVYITVYEGNKSGEGTETKSGYQLNKGTADYIDEIASVFSTVNRKGKLIIAK